MQNRTELPYRLTDEQKAAIHEWLDFSFQHPSDEALDTATESLAAAIENATEQPEDLLDGLEPFIADVIRDELRECAHDEWTPESLAAEIIKRLRDDEQPTVQAQRDARQAEAREPGCKKSRTCVLRDGHSRDCYDAY